jgi:hypothetical protein
MCQEYKDLTKGLRKLIREATEERAGAFLTKVVMVDSIVELIKSTKPAKRKKRT